MPAAPEADEGRRVPGLHAKGHVGELLDPDQPHPLQLPALTRRLVPREPSARLRISPSRATSFVYQNARGRWASDGRFLHVRPHLPAKTGTEYDESADTYDTIDWLIKNISGHNGRAGLGCLLPGLLRRYGSD